MMKHIMGPLLASAIAAASPVAASAATITFDDLGGPATIFANPVTAGGFLFTNANPDTAALGIWGSDTGFSADPNGHTLTTFQWYSATTMTKIGGGTFSLTSIDLADVFNQPNNGGDVLFSFVDAGGTFNQIVTTDNLAGLETFTFNKTGLLSFSYEPLTTYGGWIQIDNVVVDAAIPEPAIWLTMIAGFAMIGISLRQTRRTPKSATA